MTAVRAFAVTENDENTGGIYFAKHDIVAKKAAASEFSDGDISQVSCKRAPWADEYAGRAVPAWVMIDAGWHFECYGCRSRIDTDWLDERRLPVDGVLGTQWSSVYCCTRCKRKDLSRTRRRKAEEQRAIEVFKAIVRKRFPEVEFCDNPEIDHWRHHAYVTRDWRGGGGWHWQQVVIAFTFPGMKIAPATYRRDEKSTWPGPFIGPVQPHYTCCSGDREAFEAYAAATRKAS
jgi:hypothetical protein